MKTLLFGLLLFAACQAKAPSAAPPPIVAVATPTPTDTARLRDTVYLAPACNYDSLVVKYKAAARAWVEAEKEKDSLRVVTDTLAKRLLHARLVISNVKYYLNITLRNQSQDKFLKGWIRRAVN